MSKSTLTHMPTQAPSAAHKNTEELGAVAKQQFVSAALTMSWQLVAVVLVPIIGGTLLDKAIGSTQVCLFIGLSLAVLGTTLVLWKAAQAANRLPVPKLSAAQKQAIKKSYEEEDND
jgi:F0F1-type ATP synthase assembly protein I